MSDLDNRKKTEELKNKVEQIKADLPDGSIDAIMDKEEKAKQNDDPIPTPQPTNDDANPDDIDISDDNNEDVDDPVDPTPADDDDADDAPEPSPAPTKEQPKDPKTELPPLEERYKESSKEATALYFRNKKITDTIMDASEMPDPTEDQMKEFAKENGVEYEDLDVFARNMLKNTLKNELRFQKIRGVVATTKEMDKWVEDVESYVEDEGNLNKYPSLQNNSDEFIKYASASSRVGMDFDDLVGAFLFKKSQDSGKDPNKRTKRSLLLDKGNGRQTPPKKKGLNEDDAKHLRLTNPKAYKKAIKEGKIKISL